MNVFLTIWIFTHLYIIQNTIDKYYLQFRELNIPKIVLHITDLIYKVITCFKCFTFWSILLISGGDVFTALLFALIAHVIMLIEEIANK